MRVALLATGVGLAVFVLVATLLSSAGLLAARWLREEDPVAAARRLFVLRLAPYGLALAAAALAVSAFVRYEPREVDETAGFAFLALAAAGAASLAAGLWRTAADLRLTRRVRRAWLAAGHPLPLEGAPVPAVRMAHEFPVVCLVGVIRPRIFVADAVLRGLSAPELEAVIAHERAHLRSADNLRRLVMRACPPLPWPALARRLEQRWQEVSEEAADVRAGRGLDLASALVAAARLAPPGARLRLGAAALLSGGALSRRVRRLCESTTARDAPARRGVRRLLMAAGALAVLAAAWPLWDRPAYWLVEALVRLP